MKGKTTSGNRPGARRQPLAKRSPTRRMIGVVNREAGVGHLSVKKKSDSRLLWRAVDHLKTPRDVRSFFDTYVDGLKTLYGNVEVAKAVAISNLSHIFSSYQVNYRPGKKLTAREIQSKARLNETIRLWEQSVKLPYFLREGADPMHPSFRQSENRHHVLMAKAREITEKPSGLRFGV